MKRNTTKLLLHNITDNDIILIASKQVLADYFSVEYETVVNWFREGVQIVRKSYNGCSYIIYKPDHYLYSRTVP